MLRFLPYIICSIFLGYFQGYGQVMTVEEVPWNTKFNEYAPVIFGDEIVYCSDRPSQFAVKWVDDSGQHPVKILRAGSSGKKHKFFNEAFNTNYNEGPVCFNAELTEIFFTGTIAPSSQKNNVSLGIFTSKKDGSKWTKVEPLHFNSHDGSYNVAHPMLSRDGNTLYFTSDKTDSQGGWDIYYSNRIEKGWSDPMNLGTHVNTSANECYPFIDEFKNIYFASNRVAENGMDIYICKYNKDHYLKATPLEEPVNSISDDFGYTSTNGGELGYFTSNRNGSDDNIYKFEYTYPAFEACPPAEQPTFCYFFEETSIVPNDSMKFIYEWELGDGNTAGGLSTEHCYKNFGSYHIALNVYDSLTRVKFARVSELDLEIAKSPFPWIAVNDTLKSKNDIAFSANGSDIADFESREYYWNFGDGRHSQGFSSTHQYFEDGIYEVQLGIIGINTITLQEEKRCATKKIIVGNPKEETTSPEDQLVSSSLHEDMVFIPDDSTTKLMYAPDSTLYYVQFRESEKPLSLDDPYFNNIKYEITERFQEKDTVYKYSVGNTTDVNVLLRIYNDLKDHGYSESLIREMKLEEYQYSTTKKWWYFADSLASAINVHLNKFNDIQFSKDNYKIRPTSFDNLDYISQVLLMEPDMKIKIMAHTDSIGTSEHNMKLSTLRAQEVVKYFISKGIDSNRLLGIGYGEEVPIATNQTEEGRSINRRVSFEIVLGEGTKR